MHWIKLYLFRDILRSTALKLKVSLYEIKRDKSTPEDMKVHLGIPKDPKI